MAKVSITQKQLNTLSRQLYGKEKINLKLNINTDHKATVIQTPSDSYLAHDLIRIILFSTAAIGLQIFISLALKNNLIKISF